MPQYCQSISRNQNNYKLPLYILDCDSDTAISIEYYCSSLNSSCAMYLYYEFRVNIYLPNIDISIFGLVKSKKN